MFMLKPPPLDSARFYATPRMLRWLLILVLAVLIPTVGAPLAREFLLSRPPASAAAPYVPELDFTTDGARNTPSLYVLYVGSIPDKPGPNQKRAGTCNPQRSEVEINGGCWVKTDHPKPCPEGFQWEHEGKCWLPVAHAAPVPTSGGGTAPVTIAE